METRFTDRFFVFPIKIYDGKTLRLNDGEEEDDNILPQIDGDWVIGYVRLNRKDLDDILWYDGYTGELSVKDVAQKGFNSTVVMTKEFGQFNCIWAGKKFESKLNEFVEQYDLMNKPVAVLNYPVYDNNGAGKVAFPENPSTTNPIPYH